MSSRIIARQGHRGPRQRADSVVASQATSRRVVRQRRSIDGEDEVKTLLSRKSSRALRKAKGPELLEEIHHALHQSKAALVPSRRKRASSHSDPRPFVQYSDTDHTFDAMDRNKDGVLDRAEFGAAMAQQREPSPRQPGWSLSAGAQKTKDTRRRCEEPEAPGSLGRVLGRERGNDLLSEMSQTTRTESDRATKDGPTETKSGGFYRSASRERGVTAKQIPRQIPTSRRRRGSEQSTRGPRPQAYAPKESEIRVVAGFRSKLCASNRSTSAIAPQSGRVLSKRSTSVDSKSRAVAGARLTPRFDDSGGAGGLFVSRHILCESRSHDELKASRKNQSPKDSVSQEIDNDTMSELEALGNLFHDDHVLRHAFRTWRKYRLQIGQLTSVDPNPNPNSNSNHNSNTNRNAKVFWRRARPHGGRTKH